MDHSAAIGGRRLSAIALALLLALLPARLLAQTHGLLVTLRGLDGAGLAGVTLVVRAPEGAELARATTGPHGTASFLSLPATVLVEAVGQGRGGPPLYHGGADARGVRVRLDSGPAPARLDLRVERDGMVLPDPLTMVDLEGDGPAPPPAGPLAEAPAATAIKPEASTVSGRPAQQPVAADQPAAEEPAPPWLAPVGAMLVAVLGVAAALLLRLHGERP